ncbi:MAG: hypothetical protein IH851_11375 [Armatimonadetes bacterium]|nr:hypothetical protein [Armatimonadota bacterium]
MNRLFITGFGPFGRFKENPSETLVHRLEDYCTAVLPVSFRAVERFVAKGLPKGFSRLLMLGVAANADRFLAERVARNQVGERPDVHNVLLAPGPIDPNRPLRVHGALFETWRHRTQAWKPSANAGNYLCNYLYYRAVTGLTGVRCGLLHVPSFETVDHATQRKWLHRVLKRLKHEA